MHVAVCVFVCHLRVLAQVSCELVSPKDSRPTEGLMIFNLELSPMASPGFQSSRYKSACQEMSLKIVFLLQTCSLYSCLFLCRLLQAVRVVSDTEQAAGEMSEELQVHRHRVSVRHLRRKGDAFRDYICYVSLSCVLF